MGSCARKAKGFVRVEIPSTCPARPADVAARRTHEETVISPGRSSLRSQVAEFLRFRELLYFLVWKNLKVRYAQAILGALWAILQPLLTALILGLLLGRLARVPTDGVPPFIFYLTALVPWTFFANGLTTAANSLVTNQQLIMKVYFPRLCLPIAGVLSAIVDLIVPLTLLLGIMAFTWRFDLSLQTLLAIPTLLAIAIIAATGLGVGLAALNLRYRDVTHVLPFLVQTLFFASPIVYSAAQMPAEWRIFYFINPMASVIDGFRAILLGSHPFSWGATAVGLASAILMFVIGVIYFERAEYRFADVA
jgi:lipopolysaccharide transport system permease protein